MDPDNLRSQDSREQNPNGIGSVVASHYNNIHEVGRFRRKESRIFFLRNFNNWLKSMLLREYINKILMGPQGIRKISALDLGCGKGGDLNKWRKLPIGHMIFADIADISVKQAQARYKELVQRYGGREPFNVEFLTADCTKDIIKDKFQNPDHQFHLVSCQFAFHYCFESLPQVETMLKNVSESLSKGGYFIGTTPDAYDIVSRVKSTPDRRKAGNSVYSVEFEEPLTEETTLPLFGAKYNFHLEGVVDCPEFLVHFPTFIKIAEKYGLILVAKRRFSSYFNEMKGKGGDLLERMDALETYKKEYDNSKSNFEQYKAAEAFFDSNKQAHILGTLSKDEWEAINIYLVFAFKKMI
uniref:mRNA cap guanine-N(7) methyltransferase n=1 Tax=Lepeophtheirus salmonis TaxID=72036 RepID=A0A0K2UVZ1_LEPSM